MKSKFFELNTLKKIEFFEIISEEAIPNWVSKLVIKEVYAASLSAEKGILEMRLGDITVPVSYYPGSALLRIFVDRTKEMDWNEGLYSFGSFLREDNLTPFNITLKYRSSLKNPETVFNGLSEKVTQFFGQLTDCEKINPEISYSDTEYKVQITIPLDDSQADRLRYWSQKNGFELSAQEAPIEEKIKS